MTVQPMGSGKTCQISWATSGRPELQQKPDCPSRASIQRAEPQNLEPQACQGDLTIFGNQISADSMENSSPFNPRFCCSSVAEAASDFWRMLVPLKFSVPSIRASSGPIVFLQWPRQCRCHAFAHAKSEVSSPRLLGAHACFGNFQDFRAGIAYQSSFLLPLVSLMPFRSGRPKHKAAVCLAGMHTVTDILVSSPCSLASRAAKQAVSPALKCSRGSCWQRITSHLQTARPLTSSQQPLVS